MNTQVSLKIIFLTITTFFVSSVWGMDGQGESKFPGPDVPLRPNVQEKLRDKKKITNEKTKNKKEASGVSSQGSGNVPKLEFRPSIEDVQSCNSRRGWGGDSYRVLSKKNCFVSATSRFAQLLKTMDWEKAEQELDNPLNLNRALDANGNRAIHQLCLENKISALEKLIGHSTVDPNIQNDMGDTALHLAAATGASKIITILLGHKLIKRNRKNDKGMSALHVACKMKRVECVKLLCASKKTKVNLRDGKKRTPLHIAVMKNLPEVVSILVKHSRVNPNIGDELGNTPLHYAAYYFFKRDQRMEMELDDDDQNDPHGISCLRLLLLCPKVDLGVRNNNDHVWGYHIAEAIKNSENNRDLNEVVAQKNHMIGTILCGRIADNRSMEDSDDD